MHSSGKEVYLLSITDILELDNFSKLNYGEI